MIKNRTKSMSEKISKKTLVEGFENQKDQIEDLIFGAKELYSSKKYNISISLSILAIEELTKLREIRDSDYLRGHMDLTAWNQLSQGAGVHAKKIKKAVEDALKRQNEKSKQHWDFVKEFVDSTIISGGGENTKIQPSYRTSYDPDMANGLNQLKQACLYLDFKDEKWFSAKLFLSKREIESLAYTTLKMAEFNLNEILLHNKHREIKVDKDSESYKNYVSDPLFKKRVEFQTLAKSKTFQIKRLVGQSALEKFKKIRKTNSK